MPKHSYKREAEELRRQLDQSRIDTTKLVRDLREMDQLVYQMATSGTPDQMRSAMQRAWAITEERMKRESARIADVLIPEIKKVYTEPNHENQRLPNTSPQLPPRQENHPHVRKLPRS